MLLSWEVVIQLLVSVFIGGIIGAEREYRNKSAGFRTMMLISLGATLFTLFSQQIGAGFSPDRIASNIVTGVGFLGAGVIFKGGSGINGITTAATIWVTAALGMGVGAGYEWIALAGAVLLLPILYGFTAIESRIDRINQAHDYRISGLYNDDFFERFENILRQYRLRFRRGQYSKSGNHLTGTWHVQGPEKKHRQFIEHMLKEKAVDRFEF